MSKKNKQEQSHGLPLGEVNPPVETNDALQQRLARLELFRSLIEESADAIIHAEASSGKIIDYNQAAAKLFDYSPQEMQQLTIQNLFQPNENILQTIHSNDTIYKQAKLLKKVATLSFQI
jgi:PAS domain-containing protein